MNLSLPSATALITRFGSKEMADLSVPKTSRPIDGLLLEAAAKGEPLDDWDAEDVASAVAALARIADAATRARSEVQFYLRYRQSGQDAPDWVADDLPELTRFHLYGEAANAESAVRLRYRDILKRLESLAAEDEKRGAAESGQSGLQISHQPRMFSRTTMRRL
ncbi:Mu-like prophage protein gp36 [Pseudomonas putida]|nr:Mu-like prophage protein gp36 [Pseudomonas putida]CAB5660706.1 Mu-like prophage protein gp36 [Pseudomonas putida]CAB5687050.1 Mu-like prophage protein gp36 [Pseudomonas putida]CAB5699382.1 Mu-like prophage protein gp36 [Pseudomonas putida]CAC9680991.1 Mu-like prophage protein gp36 [Pseudomonas putida]